jgi:hypothetical protein
MKSMNRHMGKVDFEETEKSEVRATTSTDAGSASKAGSPASGE